MQGRTEPLLDRSVFALDAAAEVDRICSFLRQTVGVTLRRKGAVVAVSGGVDSAVCLALAARALGEHRVYGLVLPEDDSDQEAMRRAHALLDSLGVACREQNIAAVLAAAGCYSERDDAIRELVPDYGSGWTCKIVIRGGANGGINYFALVTRSPEGKVSERRLPHRAYLQIVAATNFKQRVRKMIEYFHADRLTYAVVGTPNRLEYDQGFFVKGGDGAADIKPIAHLYKTQVYALAEHLGIDPAIRRAAPSTDTFSMEQGQDEFYFALPYEQMDLALWCFNHGIDASRLAGALGIDCTSAERVYGDIRAKRQATRYNHWPPILVDPVKEVGPDE